MSEDEYKPLYTLAERIVSLVAQISEAAGRFSVSGDQALRLRRANRERRGQPVICSNFRK